VKSIARHLLRDNAGILAVHWAGIGMANGPWLALHLRNDPAKSVDIRNAVGEPHLGRKLLAVPATTPLQPGRERLLAAVTP
jgi:hypothetical protein